VGPASDGIRTESVLPHKKNPTSRGSEIIQSCFEAIS
jgi:hypothetical protein